MEIDDPIQQLLKNTGWSCEDLLEKLQQYKSQKEKSKKESYVSPEKTQNTNTTYIEEYLVDSSEKVYANNIAEVQKVQSQENATKITQISPENRTAVTANSHSLNEEFSDTDEEEVEVKVTNSNIINEIIDDISSAENIEEAPGTNTIFDYHSQSFKEAEATEVTEVRVIEVNDEDDDDCFEETNSLETANITEATDSGKVNYLETYPRKFHRSLQESVKQKINATDTSTTNKAEIPEITLNNDDQDLSNNHSNLDGNSNNLVKTCEVDNTSDTVDTLNSNDQELSNNHSNLNGNSTDVFEICEIDDTSEDTSSETSKAKSEVPNVLTYPPASVLEVIENHAHTKDDENEVASENLEDIRNNLKLQLNCLRTRKKGHFLQELRTNVAGALKFHESTLEKRDISAVQVENSKKITSPESSANKDEPHLNSDINTICIDSNTENDSLYTQTNEFGLVILDVQGGVDIDNIDEEFKPNVPEDNIQENSLNMLNSVLENSTDCNDSSSFLSDNNVLSSKEERDANGVFDEIRKIIRKQKDTSKNNKRSEVMLDRNIDKPNGNIDNFAFFSSPLKSQLNEERLKNQKKHGNANMSTENSLSSLAAEDTVDKNSPFVSNTLDEFLTENSKLNISYKVPKCGAEEGLTDSYREESPLVLKKVIQLEQASESKSVPKIKAKTVAQKRKILEKQRLKELKKSESKKASAEKPKPVGIDINRKNNSFIIINNQKIWVNGTTADTCIATLNFINSAPVKRESLSKKVTNDKGKTFRKNERRKKLSLLTDLEKKLKEQVKYRPGPLSRKPNLQVSGQDNWQTEMKALPKILLEVTPMIGEPISYNILSRLPQNNGNLTESQIEFALSVLRTKNYAPKYKTFKFPLSYSNNQENIIVRKQKVSPIKYISRELCDEQKCVEDIVSDVINNLIQYVEIKEIAPTLIKEEEKVKDNNIDDVLYKMPSIPENVSNIFKKPPKKKSRIELELSRLSCKVVNVEIEETDAEELCKKSYCQLGCICKSLKCERNISYHCQKIECMLECTCPKEKSIVYDKLTLPAGTDILSTDAVNRIEDEAKKDLAKVEREFTQTVIHTNDKTIVVGAGGRNKTRRVTKTPKKYSDFVDSTDIKETEKEKITQQTNFFKKCFVSLEKLSLPGIIPFCLVHNLYNCFCEKKLFRKSEPVLLKPRTGIISTHPVNKEEIGPTVDEPKSTSSKIYKKQTDKIRSIEHKESHNEINRHSSDSEKFPEEGISPSKRPVRNIKKTKLQEDFSYSDELSFNSSCCARTRRIPSSVFQHRKRLGKSKSKSKQLLLKHDFINNITEADLLKAKISSSNKKQMLEVDLLKNHLITEFHRQKIALSLIIENSYCDKNRHKRKQTLQIRSDDGTKASFNQDLAIQRRKKTALLTRKNTVIEPVFDGEIIIDDKNMELLKKMGPKTVMEGYARLLPWKALTESFQNGSIKIWSMVDQPSRLLINKSDKLPPKNYVNISQTNQTSDVVLWILNNKLPDGYYEDNVSFILKQTKDNYEICGLCTKNLTEDSLINKQNDNNSENENGDNAEENLTQFKHRDLNGEQKLLYIKKRNFQLQELIEENLEGLGERSIDKSKLYMWAALPEIYRVCKWRMIFLNSDFTYLYFTRLKYSIKYTDLLSVGNMAKSEKCTVLLRNELMQQAYDHIAFGIYFDAHYQDRLFIGPYFKQFNADDVETLRYINKSLVCTESFNKMQGKMDYKCGHWLVERPYGAVRRRTQEAESTIDLTDESDEVGTCKSSKRKDNFDINQTFKRPRLSYKHSENEHIVITHKNAQIKVIDGKPRKPEDFNRYIITNIPHLGYLGAYQHTSTSEIDVSWPFENKLLRFSSVNGAIDFLQERFSSLLQPVPETFRINVIILMQIDLANSHPINASILSGHYICGEFGCYNIKTVTNEFCIDKIGKTKEELVNIFAKRAQAFVKKKIEELAAILSIKKPDLDRYDIVNILEMTKKEVDKEKEIEKNNIAMKNDLLLQKRELALKIIGIISALPEEQRLIENLKFRQILSTRSINQPKMVESIEIHDSDEEESKFIDASKSSIKDPPVIEAFKGNISDENSKEIHSTQPFETDNVHLDNSPKQASLLKDGTVPTKVTETATSFPLQRKLKLKSVLKPKFNLSISSLPGVESSTSLSENSLSSTDSDQTSIKNITPQPQYITGVKIVKTSSGKLMLVSDDANKAINKPSKPSIGMGTKVVIKNNKILSVKSIEINQKVSKSNISCTEISSNSVTTEHNKISDENVSSIQSILQNSEIVNESNGPSRDKEDNTNSNINECSDQYSDTANKSYNLDKNSTIKTDLKDSKISRNADSSVTGYNSVLKCNKKSKDADNNTIDNKTPSESDSNRDCIDHVNDNNNISKNYNVVNESDMLYNHKIACDSTKSKKFTDHGSTNKLTAVDNYELDLKNDIPSRRNNEINDSSDNIDQHRERIRNKNTLNNCSENRMENLIGSSLSKDTVDDEAPIEQNKATDNINSNETPIKLITIE